MPVWFWILITATVDFAAFQFLLRRERRLRLEVVDQSHRAWKLLARYAMAFEETEKNRVYKDILNFLSVERKKS